jgi:hypothetical protein
MDEEPQDCAGCEEPRFYDDLDEEGFCGACVDARGEAEGERRWFQFATR